MNPPETNQKPIIFIHGAWHGAWCWDQWIPLFHEEGFRNTIAVELSGHGYKPGQLNKARLKDYVADVERIIAECGEHPILIGHSLGCSVIRHLSEQNRFSSAVLLAPIPTGDAFKKAFMVQAIKHPILTLHSLVSRQMQPWVTSRLAPRLFFSQYLSRDKAKDYVSRMQGESIRLFLLDLLKDAQAEHLPYPSLVIAAEEDAFFTVRSQNQIAQQLGSDLFTSPQSGHDIMLDVSSTETARRVIDWLKTISRTQ